MLRKCTDELRTAQQENMVLREIVYDMATILEEIMQRLPAEVAAHMNVRDGRAVLARIKQLQARAQNSS
jgi:hypothetical protein